VSEAAERDWLGGVIAASGGSALVVGALLPWMSLFAGLQRYAGVSGLYGRLLLIGGATAIVAGLAMVVRPRRRLRPVVGVLGLLLTAFASWVLYGLRATLRGLEHHPLLLARPGAGLFVALAGALLITVLIVPHSRGAAARAPERSGVA
jgi:hypothetical protein